MTHHLVLGAGGVGRSTTAALVALGHTVTLASRSGRVVERPWQDTHPDAVEVVAVDASDASALTAVARGAASIVNAVNPPSYMTWDTDWPPIAAATLTAAARPHLRRLQMKPGEADLLEDAATVDRPSHRHEQPTARPALASASPQRFPGGGTAVGSTWLPATGRRGHAHPRRSRRSRWT